jgi:hypothetical protein
MVLIRGEQDMYGIHRYTIALIGVLVIASPVLVAHAASTPSGCKYYFIIYGQDWCPHCQNMEKFVIENYGARCLEFRDLDIPKWNQNFTLIINEFNSKYKVPAQAAFPLTGILVNGKLRAILQGEITSKQVMDYLVEKANKEGSDWIAVYTNGLYVIKPDDTILHAFKPEQPSNSLGVTLGPANSATSPIEKGGGRNNALIAAGVTIIIAGVIAAVILARR